MANENLKSATGTPTTGRADYTYKPYYEYRYEGGAARQLEVAPQIYPEPEREPQQQPVRRPQRRPAPAPNRKALQKNRNRLESMNLKELIVAAICVTICIAAAVMHLQLHTGLDAKIAKAAALESELSSMRMRNDEMENKINVGIDYAAIYEQAVNDLGMTYPGKDQLIYYTAEKSEYFEMNADNTNP
ncbi:MAG: hypothetical protein IKX10_06750 [Lachnospiraceae bacterium]|nr:hypothetical protein [Lachnospiraceae bacterium]